MAEFAALSGAAGIISLGITACNGIIKYYVAYSSQDNTQKSMLKTVTELTKTLDIVQKRLNDPKSLRRTVGQDAIARLLESINACGDTISSLEKKLEKITKAKQDASLKKKMAKFGRKSLYPFKESTMIKLKELCNECSQHLTLVLNILCIDLSVSTIDKVDTVLVQVIETNDGVQSVKRGVGTLKEAMSNLTLYNDDNIVSKAVEWLSPLHGVHERRQQEYFNIEGRQQENAQRLVQSHIFRDWLTSPGRALWFTGGPGIGKTVMASFIINHLQHDLKSQDIGIAYLYCRYKDAEQETTTDLIATLLQQLSAQHAGDLSDLLTLYKTHAKAQTRPNLQEYSNLILKTAEKPSRIYIIVDAIDECSDINNNRETFIKELSRLLPSINLLLLSRPLPHLQKLLENTHCASLQADDEDMEAYITKRITNSRNLTGNVERDPDLAMAIINKVTSAAKGMFLLVRLHMDSLITMMTPRKVKAALERLPQALNQVYDDIIHRIRNQTPEEMNMAMSILSWIFFAPRPLAISEIQSALAIEDGDTEYHEDGEPDRDSMISACAGLVIVSDKMRAMAFVHYTAQEYFEQHAHSVLGGGHNQLARTCLTCLLLRDSSDLSTSLPNRQKRITSLENVPLHEYAILYWDYHVRQCATDQTDESTRLAVRLLSLPRRIDDISNARRHAKYFDPKAKRKLYYLYYSTGGEELTGLSVAASLGLVRVVSELLKLDHAQDVNALDDSEKTALHHALQGEFLLDTSQIGDGSFDACGRGRLQCVLAIFKALLSAGANVNIVDGKGDTPLHCVAIKKWTGLIDPVRKVQDPSMGSEIVELARCMIDYVSKLEGDVGMLKFVNIENESGHTALEEALIHQNLNIANLLLACNGRLGTTHRGLHYTFRQAATQNTLSGIKFLLHVAREHFGHESMWRMINSRDKDGWSAMHYASRSGNLSLTKLLLASGGELKATHGAQMTVLQCAFLSGEAEIMDYLLRWIEKKKGAKDLQDLINAEMKDWQAKTKLLAPEMRSDYVENLQAAYESLSSHDSSELNGRGSGLNLTSSITEHT